MLQIVFLLVFFVLGQAINCTEFDGSLDMQQQLQLRDFIVPFNIDPPFSYLEGDGRFGGFAFDILAEVALRGNFTVTVTAAVDNETDGVLQRMVESFDIVGSHWTDTPARRAAGVLFSTHFIDTTRYLVTPPDQPRPFALTDNMFTFLVPFSDALWVVILFGICFSGAVTYGFEMSEICGRKEYLKQALESSGKRWKVYWGFLYRSFAHFTMSGDSLEAKSVMGQTHNVVWAFVVLVLLSAYTANLASTLVVKKIHNLEYGSVQAIMNNNKMVCVSGTEDRDLLNAIPFPENVVPYNFVEVIEHDPGVPRAQELADAMFDGRCVGAIMTTSAFQILRTNVTYCSLSKRTQVGQTVGASFAFPIDRCGSFYLAVVNSILTGMRADRTIDKLWSKEIRQVNCPAVATQTVAVAQGLGIDSFAGLFILYLCWIACTIFLRFNRKMFTCMNRTIKRIKRYFNPADAVVEDTTIDTTPEKQVKDEVDLDSLNAKVNGVEHTIETIMAALRDFKTPAPDKTSPAPEQKAQTGALAIHARTNSKGTVTPKSGGTSVETKQEVTDAQDGAKPGATTEPRVDQAATDAQSGAKQEVVPDAQAGVNQGVATDSGAKQEVTTETKQEIATDAQADQGPKGTTPTQTESNSSQSAEVKQGQGTEPVKQSDPAQYSGTAVSQSPTTASSVDQPSTKQTEVSQSSPAVEQVPVESSQSSSGPQGQPGIEVEVVKNSLQVTPPPPPKRLSKSKLAPFSVIDAPDNLPRKSSSAQPGQDQEPPRVEPEPAQPEPAREQPEPAQEQPEPAREQPEPAQEQPKPAQLEPVQDQREPAQDQPEPAQKQDPELKIEEPAIVGSEPDGPAVEPDKSAVEPEKPIVEPDAPAVEPATTPSPPAEQEVEIHADNEQFERRPTSGGV